MNSSEISPRAGFHRSFSRTQNVVTPDMYFQELGSKVVEEANSAYLDKGVPTFKNLIFSCLQEKGTSCDHVRHHWWVFLMEVTIRSQLIVHLCVSIYSGGIYYMLAE